MSSAPVVSGQVDAIYIYLILVLMNRHYKYIYSGFYAIPTCRICQPVKDVERETNKHLNINSLYFY